MAALTWNPRIPVETILTLGLVFEVAASFGIAAAQFLDVSRYAGDKFWIGLSWVAVWMSSFTVMIPSPPRRALAAALASAASVPLVVGFVITTNLTSPRISAVQFFIVSVLPYLLVVLIAYVGARVVYNLGAELHRARELEKLIANPITDGEDRHDRFAGMSIEGLEPFRHLGQSLRVAHRGARPEDLTAAAMGLPTRIRSNSSSRRTCVSGGFRVESDGGAWMPVSR